ncbi:hypothetical protein OsI_32612 [Oryza sativa Indica Group]|uniref:Uncharacterized protein n=1 Tax=Oryza sativa subsp. indica TaxID=39946 RepID=B8BFH7_ORYSI|nr:hypothetical protein OsI_32612 [Oryza sativa Indica Group]
MEVTAGPLGALLPKLTKLLQDEYNLEKHVREGIKSLEIELKMMNAALHKVAEVPLDQLDDQVKIWASNVREISYDMEDAVDAFMVRVEDDSHSRPNTFKKRVNWSIKMISKLFKKAKELHQIADAIKEAQALAQQMAGLRERYSGLELQNSGVAATIDPRLTALYIDAIDLVGIDHAREELIKILTEGEDSSKQQLKIISIVGFGGLGKTTLARAVHEKIGAQFDCAAFVSVSRNPDIRMIFKKILHQLEKEKYTNINESSWDETQLIDELREFLQDKRYFIIIDDLWNERVWDYIKCAFPKDNLGSRLIMTTRNVNVSKACCSANNDIIYKMKPLSDDDSKKLFYKRIFPHGNGCPCELEEVSNEILKKCGGVPLAIITIASLLANKEIQTKDQWYTLHNSIGRGLTEGRNVEDMQKILSFSYYDLPSHLKSCLFCLSVFPEDYEISRDRLIWRWIAEGFVQQTQKDGSLFEQGENYFNELINRNMIQPIDIDAEGKAKACRVHDMVLDLICHLSSEHNFITVFDDIGNITSSGKKIRRLSLQYSMTECNTTWCTMTTLQVRSLTIFSPAINLMPSLSSFKMIRVLDLEGCDLGKSNQLNLMHVGCLLHLRYLGLRDTLSIKWSSKHGERSIGTYVIRELPTQIGKLEFLQTLDLVESGIKELPVTVVQLRRLMCLHVDYHTRLPNGLGKMTALEELSYISTSHFVDIVKELHQLTRLRVLAIRWKELGEKQDKAFVDCLGSLHKLQSLEIHAWGGGMNLMKECWVPPVSLRRFLPRGPTNSFSTLPAWINPSLLITCLDIWVDQVRSGDIQILGELPALCSITFMAIGSIEESVVERFVVSTNAFQRATECTFFNFVTVPSMFPRGAMPRVRFLHFSLLAWDNNMAIGNGSRGDLDLAMGHLPSLERVAVDLWCRKASRAEVEAVEAALRRATDVHPNNPTLVVYRYHAGHLREQENNLADVEDEKESSPPSVTTDM